ncbi:hypothetical protein QOZ80_2BG0159840 [Eleusine coracana subsp. coracana]|nr:hypothetical protein QOZ80_2BG0159840 [Eleusine coracana subsp. coracana]
MTKTVARGGGVLDDDQGDGCALPEDQVLEMLTRVSLDDLAACRMVSARWRRLTYEPGFARLHCRRRRTDIISGYFLQSVTRNRYHADFVSMHSSSSEKKKKKISLAFLPSAHVRVVAVAAHRGLVCCEDADDTRRGYYVCKPATRQWRALPNPRARFRTAAMAMVARPSSAAELKIVRLSFSSPAPERLMMRCEVFDSRRYAWRRAADVALCPYSLAPSAPAVWAHGAAHWLRWPDPRTGKQDVFAFDVRTDTWRLIGLPREVDDEVVSRWARRMIVAVESRLCLVVVTMEGDEEEEVVEVWEMASYVHERWERKMAVGLKEGRRAQGPLLLRHRILRQLLQGDVVIHQ